MKKLMNLSKLAIAALITSSLFVACSEEISENTVDTKYTAQTGNLGNAGQAVDLGLPSGTLWANKNVGASDESDNGILFIWGDITGKLIYAENDATYTNVIEATSFGELFNTFTDLTKTGVFCDTTNIVKTSQAKLIGTSDMTPRQKKEAVLAYLRAKLEEYKDLAKEIDDKKKKDDPDANFTFLTEATLDNDGWTVLLNPDGDDRIPNLWTYFGYDKLEKEEQEARKTDFPPDGISVEDSLKYYDSYRFDKETSVTIDEIAEKEYSYKVSELVNNDNNNYSSIKDLVGKERRKDYIGGTIGNSIKDIQGLNPDPENGDRGKLQNYTFVPAYYIFGDAEYDAARASWGSAWRMPTTKELAELYLYCTWEFEGTGYRVTGPNGNSIFLPAAGYRHGEKLYGEGNSGYYASGEILGTYAYPSMKAQSDGSEGDFGSKENMPSVLIFQHGQYNTINLYNNMSASYGLSIRPVANLLK